MGRWTNAENAAAHWRMGEEHEAKMCLAYCSGSRAQLEAERLQLKDQQRQYLGGKEAARMRYIERSAEIVCEKYAEADVQGCALGFDPIFSDPLTLALQTARIHRTCRDADYALWLLYSERTTLRPYYRSKKDADLPSDESIPASLIISLNIIREIEKTIQQKLKDPSP